MGFRLGLVQVILLAVVAGLSQDCSALRSLGTSLKMNIGTDPNTMNELNNDCCTATGITCNWIAGVQRVTKIAWQDFGLTGTFSPNIFRNMQSIISIDISKNAITGTLPVGLPESLISLNLGGNLLSGIIPTSWPSELSELVI